MLTNKTPLDARCVTIKCRGKSETYLINWTDLYCKKDLFRKSEMVWVSKDGQVGFSVLLSLKYEYSEQNARRRLHLDI